MEEKTARSSAPGSRELPSSILWPDYTPTRSSLSPRIQELAHPKLSKAIWTTPYGEKIVWGNQEPIRPISSGALSAEPSERISSLAQPKKDNQRKAHQHRSIFWYSCGRESRIWELPPPALTMLPSDRILHLAEPKKYRPQTYLHDSSDCYPESPIWKIKPAALQCKASAHVIHLSHPKALHLDFKCDREVETRVSLSAREARSSERTDRLAIPKDRRETMFFETGAPEEPIRPVSKSACFSTASSRIQELAKTKKLPEGYQPERNVIWIVSNAAKRAVATPRIEELAKPLRG
ncbi:testicular haploid expressed gene protein-like isoform X2 [Protopterus annectens]|nr:testicular haploid expressed gene protein-like isoform X2 [Protopterus annectens]